MKKLLMTISVIIFGLASMAQNDTLIGYYYANGAKQYWQTDSTSINIIVGNQLNYDSIAARLERIVNRNGGVVIYDNEDNNIIVNSPTKLTLNNISNLINNVVIFRDDVVFTSYAKNLNGGRLWPTNEVYVKLKDSLYYYSHVVPIVSNYTNVTSFYEGDKEWRLVCKNENDVIRLANHLYDTNYVVYSTPDYYDDNFLFCNINDPFYNNQWALHNTNNGIDIKVEKAWSFLDKILGETGSYIKVAVIDDGVEEHEDLYLSGGENKVLAGYTANGDGTGRPRPNNKHGECCAGIIAASHNNIGIAGIAPNARIVPIRIFKNNGKGFSVSRIAKSIKKTWTDFNCSILNNSWSIGQNDMIRTSINYVCSNGRNGKGCIVVAAAGNDMIALPNGDIIPAWVQFPAFMENVISVGAIGSNGNRMYYSDYSKELNIVAPGDEIYTIDRMGNYGFNGTNYYESFDKTSAACPHVSGVAALMLSANPQLTRQQVINIIEQTAQKNLGNYFDYPNYIDTINGIWNEEVGYGLVDAHKAVVKAYLSGCNMVINGPVTINECSQYTYAFSMPKSEAFTYVWQVSNNLSIISKNDSIVTVVPCGNGNATITADLYSEGRYVHSVSKNIQINGNNLSGYYSICSGPRSVNNNETWSNNNLLLGNTVTVEDGGILTITGTIHCLENASIIVKPGGKLFIDGGTLTSACPGEMWQGIQVWGNSSAPQTATNGVYQQGYVELKNGATIENAVCALDLWKPNDLTKTGGIAVATDANFINNAKSVRAMYYVYVNGNNAEVSNKTSFSNCSFVIDEYYLGTEMFHEHAELEDVKGINFSGCSFDVFSILDDVSDDCSAIRATDANFVVSAYFDPQNVTLYPTSVPTFSNFYAAINVAHSTYTQRPFNVSDAVFTGNINGIYAINSGHPLVSNCEFNIPNYGSQCSYGIYVEGVSGMIISDNDFAGNGYGSNSCGIGVKDSPYTNTVKKNSFSNLAYGNKSMGLNYYPQLFMFQSPEGLKYTCNTNSGNIVADFCITKEVNMGGGFSLGGIMTQGASSLSAGNTFSTSPMHHIYNSVSSNTLTYYYDTIYPDRKPTVNYYVNAVKTNNANTCNSGNVSKGSIITDYEEAEDNCNRIKTALEAENDPNNIEVLETELAQAEHQRLSIIGNAVRNIMMDSISDINEARLWLGRANTPDADRAICATYLSQGDYETALNKAVAMIDKYEMEDDALIEQTEYIGILKLQRKVETEGRVMEQLNGEELGQVQRLAENGTGVARSMAKAIMMMNGMAEAECDCNSELAETTRGNEGTKADAITENEEDNAYYFNISPVPAKDYIIVSYNLPTDHATLKITNNLGMKVRTVNIEGKQGKKIVSLAEISAGVYTCTIQGEGFVKTEKIVITK